MWNSALSEELSSSVGLVSESMNRKASGPTGTSGNTGRSLGVTRVSQLDGELLDSELQTLIKSQLDTVFKHVPQYSGFVARVQPEVNALVRFLLWTFSHRINNSSPGDKLQNLRYRNELRFSSLSSIPYVHLLLKIHGDEPTRLQRMLHGIGTVLVPYAFDRLKNRALISQWSTLPEDDTRYRVYKWLERLEKVWSVLQVLNMLLFLYDGRYRSLLDRILFMRLVYDKVEGGRNVAFEIVNQQLLYDGFSEMLIALLPLVDWARIQRAGYRLQTLFSTLFDSVKKNLPVITLGGKPLTTSPEDSEKKEQVEPNLDASQEQNLATITCAFCSEEACMPYVLNCGHYYCYYCLQSNYMSNDNLTCHTCSTLITGSRRL